MSLGKTIQKLRKEKGLTQNELADKLFVSYQAVSQWENENTNPDVSIIPSIADALDVSIDELFGHKKEENINEINIKDYTDETLYILLVEGNKLRKLIDYKETQKNYKDIQFEVSGNIKDIYSHFSVKVEGDVSGSIYAGDGVACENVGGNINAGDGIACGNVTGNVTAGDGIACGNIEGNVEAGDDVVCGNIIGDVTAGDSVTCGTIEGNVDADVVNISNNSNKE